MMKLKPLVRAMLVAGLSVMPLPVLAASDDDGKRQFVPGHHSRDILDRHRQERSPDRRFGGGEQRQERASRTGDDDRSRHRREARKADDRQRFSSGHQRSYRNHGTDDRNRDRSSHHRSSWSGTDRHWRHSSPYRFRYSRSDHRQHSYRRHYRYYAPGYHLRHLPHNHSRLWYRDRDYYYYDGAFFLHFGDGYRVVHAPIGARIRVLPHGYISFHLGSHHYFYHNHTYYRRLDSTREYVVVEAPAGAEQAVLAATEAGLGELFVYPRNGQSAEDQDRDRFECHFWAIKQADYDPGGDDQNPELASDFRRALTACLEGRGYTVK